MKKELNLQKPKTKKSKKPSVTSKIKGIKKKTIDLFNSDSFELHSSDSHSSDSGLYDSNDHNVTRTLKGRIENNNKNNFQSIKRILQENSLSINHPFTKEEQNTILHYAAEKNAENIIGLLLEEKNPAPKINSKNALGNTALNYAALNGNYDIINLLCINGAKVGKNGPSLLDILIEQKHFETIKNLLREGDNTYFRELIQEKSLDKCLILIEILGEEDILSSTMAGDWLIETLLISVETTQEKQLIEEIKNQLNSCNAPKNLLSYAIVENKPLDLIEKLLPQCRDQINDKAILGRTPLHSAIISDYDKKFDLVQLLLENNARCNLRDKSGKLPLDYLNYTRDEDQKIKELLISSSKISFQPHDNSLGSSMESGSGSNISTSSRTSSAETFTLKSHRTSSAEALRNYYASYAGEKPRNRCHTSSGKPSETIFHSDSAVVAFHSLKNRDEDENKLTTSSNITLKTKQRNLKNNNKVQDSSAKSKSPSTKRVRQFVAQHTKSMAKKKKKPKPSM